MNEHSKILDRLRKKEQEIQTLEDRLRSARVYAQALQDVLKLMVNPDLSEDAPKVSTLRTGSTTDHARQIILARGEPVHIVALLEAMGKDVSAETRASLAGSLAAYVRRNEIFTRPAPNTFGLIELNHNAVDESNFDIEPPIGFGRISNLSNNPAGTSRETSTARFDRSVHNPGETPRDSNTNEAVFDDDIPF